MSDGNAPAPPVAPAVTPAPPTKMPMKVPIAVGKMPIAVGKVPLAPGAIPIKVQVKIPIAPVAVKVPAPAAPQTVKVLKAAAGAGGDSDDDDMLLGGGGGAPKTAQQRPSIPVKQTLAAKRVRKEASVSSSSSSDDSSVASEESEESGDDEDNMSLLDLAKREGLLNMELADHEDPVIIAVPPRPPVLKWTSNLDGAIQKQQETVDKKEAAVKMKDDNKAVSLGTSKTNYIDPRIICAWCTREGVPIKKCLTSSLIEKFPWALNVDKDYRF